MSKFRDRIKNGMCGKCGENKGYKDRALCYPCNIKQNKYTRSFKRKHGIRFKKKSKFARIKIQKNATKAFGGFYFYEA